MHTLLRCQLAQYSWCGVVGRVEAWLELAEQAPGLTTVGTEGSEQLHGDEGLHAWLGVSWLIM